MKKFTKEWYLAKQGTTVVVGGKRCTVTKHRTESRGGSWERGFRFYHSYWGMLRRQSDGQVSLDHGVTWFRLAKSAMKSKNKVRLESDNHGELAFNSIQAINRKYEGPGYTWSR